MGPKAGVAKPRKIEGPEGWGTEGWGQNFTLFFSFTRLKFHSLCSLWASSRGISVVFEAHQTGPPGLAHDDAESPDVEGSGLQKHHRNSTRRPPRESTKSKILGGIKKKERNLGPSSKSMQVKNESQQSQSR